MKGFIIFTMVVAGITAGAINAVGDLQDSVITATENRIAAIEEAAD